MKVKGRGVKIMSIKELKIYITAQIANLEKYTDNDGYMDGYIRALTDTLDRIKG